MCAVGFGLVLNENFGRIFRLLEALSRTVFVAVSRIDSRRGMARYRPTDPYSLHFLNSLPIFHLKAGHPSDTMWSL